MSSRPGCFRPFLFGCLGLLGLGVLILLVGLLMAWRGVQRGEVVDAVVAAGGEAAAPVLTARAPGKVILELGQGEFYVLPADSGAGVSVQARFDRASHVLEDSLTVQPDGTWVYRVHYGSSISMVQAMFQQLLGGSTESRVEVRIPPDLPIELVLVGEQGGAQIDLGGLWLTAADLEFHMGGAEIDFSTPLHRPLERLDLRSSMGGLEVTGVGNASPRVLDVSSSMGGVAMDLAGAWAGDCRARFRVRMGGMAIGSTPGLVVRPWSEQAQELQPQAAEVPVPTLWYEADVSMGEIDISR